MKYYLRKMHGSFVTWRLLRMEDVEFPEPIDGCDEEKQVVMHMWGVPNRRWNSSFHYVLGPDRTSDGGMMAGHHCGQTYRVSEKAALRILEKAK